MHWEKVTGESEKENESIIWVLRLRLTGQTLLKICFIAPTRFECLQTFNKEVSKKDKTQHTCHSY